MTCREFVDFLMSYLDGELEAEPRRVFEEHLQGCPTCVEYMESYKQAVELGRCACQDEEGPPPEDVPPQLVDAILAARKALP
jgi:anti-sigma factor RsiW